MLNYLITVTENTAVTAILTGLLYAFVFYSCKKEGRRILTGGVVLGIAAAAVMAILKNTTKIIDNSGGTGMWNVRIFSVSLLTLIIYYVLSLKPIRRRLGTKGNYILSAVMAVMAFTLIFYSLPDVLAYPFTFSLNGASVFSTAFFYRLIGYILGIILALVICFSVEHTARKVSGEVIYWVLNTALFINALQQAAKIIQVLHAKRIISGHILFVIARHSSNYSNIFIYAVMLTAFIIPIILFIKSFHVNEPYENSAQHRKIRAKWRSIRRRTVLLTSCFVLVILNMTLFTALDNKEVELSPIEDCEICGDNVYVALTQVEDGHLHRFAYKTAGGTDIRFIVIKKPNASSYGVGLDACDICGETGYYERNGQIVCKLCDVVMNINTIGFKGGCNPIVIDYSVENGYIIVPTYTLLEHEKEFK